MEKPTDSEIESLISKIDEKGEKFKGMLMKAFMNTENIEEIYRVEGHAQNPERVISEIKSMVYNGKPLDPWIKEHLDECRQCHRLLRYHNIRKGLYEQLGLDISGKED